MAQKTWLITGTSSGLGLSLAETVLRAGHKVLATARNPAKAALENPQITQLGGIWLELDVTKPDTSSRVAEYIKENSGVIDIVVNNAGYSLLGSIEDMTEEEIQSQFETNFFGTVRVLKGVLPYMRERRSGVVVNVGSSAGVFGWPACSMYSASKFALEGMSESLAGELEPFGIRVLIVEPGIFRTKFLSSFTTPAAGVRNDYIGSPVDQTIQSFKEHNGVQTGDPAKAALRIFEIVMGTGMGEGKEGLRRLILGPDCWAVLKMKVENLGENLEGMREIAHSTDFE